MAADPGPSRLCRLQDAVHRIEMCPGTRCPFWEEGGPIVEPGCAFERINLELHAQPELAHQLLEMRKMLEQPASENDVNEARRLFFRLLDDVVEWS
jgi:hypothetical protein